MSRSSFSTVNAVTITLLLVGAGLFILRENMHAQQGREWAKEKFGLSTPVNNRLAPEFVDNNADLVADPPADEAKWLRPEKLVFSFVAGDKTDDENDSWKPVAAAIQEATELPVEIVQFENVPQQMKAFQAGELHVTGINTGLVPTAVDAYGFVPFCAVGDELGQIGIRSVIIVPADSDIKSVDDLKNRTVAFTSQQSNSGFKAPLMLLSEEYNMSPDIEYAYRFSNSHDSSIEQIANKLIEAAAVASDLLDRAVADGVIGEEDFRIIYQSEKFPPAAIGHCHNLDPAIAEEVRTALVGLRAEGALAEMFSHIPGARLIPVSYKDNWSLIRRIDSATGVRHQPIVR